MPVGCCDTGFQPYHGGFSSTITFLCVLAGFLLLPGFPFSSAEMLTEEGEIHVALCNGQGGTPADQPRREWHNSWQIVAVAAGAGFILSNIHPFKAETIPGYKCTGYR